MVPPNETVIPSFILLAIQHDKVTCYVYELINEEVQVSKTEFTKSSMITASSAESNHTNELNAKPAVLTNT